RRGERRPAAPARDRSRGEAARPFQGFTADCRRDQGRAGRRTSRGDVTPSNFDFRARERRVNIHGMTTRHLSRRTILRFAGTLPLVYAAPLGAAAPPAQAVTPALVAAATKEGQVTWYTSADLQLAEKVGKAFEQKFPGIRARVERAGGERIFSRVAQEYAAGLHIPDAVSTGDAAQFLVWKRQGLLAAYVPEDVARHIPAEHRDPDGLYATVRSSLCVMAYNTQLVSSAAAPKSFADLLDPRWKGKIVKAHPSYSGTI